MDRRGGCCIARYAGAGYDDAKKMERVMLKFRPIAPKPATGGSVFGSSSSENNNNNNNSNKTSSGETMPYVKAGRGKRKYTTNGGAAKRAYGGGRKRVRASSEENINNNKRKAVDTRDESSGDAMTVVTLPLLPESPTENKTPTSRYVPPAPIWLSFNSPTTPIAENNSFTRQQRVAVGGRYGGGGGGVRGLRVVGSGVTVECVTEMWVGGEGLGRTDEERVRNLEWDTCPGFVSDGQNRVTWTNRAYKKMAVGEDEGGEVVVWLAMKERVPVCYPAFTCRVRVENTCTKEIKVSPCDVWRMDGGGFAWRLDVKAALSLGR